MRRILPGLFRLENSLDFEPEIPELNLIATSAAIVRMFGPAGAIWLGNALQARRWSILHNKDDWFWSSKESIEEHTGLSSEQQETARRRLRGANVLEERRGRLERGASLASIWYRVNLRVLRREMASNDCRETRQSNAEDAGERSPGTAVNDHTSSTSSSTSSPVANATGKPAKRATNVEDPFGLNVPRIKEETFTLADKLSRMAGITPLTHKPTKRANTVQNALDSLRNGRFLLWAQLHKPWLMENDLPTKDLPASEDIMALLAPALAAHREAVQAGSRLAVDNLAEFFVTRTADGWSLSPMWRFFHQGFQTASPVTAKLRADILARKGGDALLLALDRRRGSDGNPNPPAEACVLRRASAALAWLDARRPAILTHYPEPPRELTGDKAFVQAIFRWIDEVESPQGSSWILDVSDGVRLTRFSRWFHEIYDVNLNLTEPKREPKQFKPTRSVEHKALWERGDNPL